MGFTFKLIQDTPDLEINEKCSLVGNILGHLERSKTKTLWERFLPLNLSTHIKSPPNMSLQFQIIKHMLKQKCHEPELGESTNRRFRFLGTSDDKRIYQIQNIK